ncbi:MAG: HIT family protein [Candidatus Thorarchaeota archaeon]
MIISHAPEGYICPFCKIAQRKENKNLLSTVNDIIYQDEVFTALVSSHQWPNNLGNVLVFPNEHYENIYDLPAELGNNLQSIIKGVALAMKQTWGCDGLSTRQHNEPAGGQDVWHYHVHVTPRYIGDEFYSNYSMNRALLSPEKRAELAHQLRRWLMVSDWKETE